MISPADASADPADALAVGCFPRMRRRFGGGGGGVADADCAPRAAVDVVFRSVEMFDAL